jgi:hypothetical protein
MAKTWRERLEDTLDDWGVLQCLTCDACLISQLKRAGIGGFDLERSIINTRSDWVTSETTKSDNEETTLFLRRHGEGHKLVILKICTTCSKPHHFYPACNLTGDSIYAASGRGSAKKVN